MPRILSVGQCGYDHGTIARHLSRSFGAEVVGAGTAGEALAALRGERFDLVLVNRVSDEDGSSGLDLVKAIKADPELSALAVMLVSNYPDAQSKAEALGALPGFGKADLATEKVAERLRAALPNSAAESPRG